MIYLLFNYREIKEVYRHDFQLGRLQCMKQCPEDPFTLAFGGEKVPKVRVFNIKNFEAGKYYFSSIYIFNISISIKLHYNAFIKKFIYSFIIIIFICISI